MAINTNPYELVLGQSRSVSIPHRNIELYDGGVWRIQKLVGPISNGITVNLQMKTSDDLVFLDTSVFRFDDGGWNIKLIEAPTVTDGDNQITPINLNRNDSFTTGVILYDNPTGISGGTILSNTNYFDVGPTRTGTTNPEILSWILKPNTDYILQLTNNSGVSSSAHATVEFHEHTEIT